MPSSGFSRLLHIIFCKKVGQNIKQAVTLELLQIILFCRGLSVLLWFICHPSDYPVYEYFMIGQTTVAETVLAVSVPWLRYIQCFGSALFSWFQCNSGSVSNIILQCEFRSCLWHPTKIEISHFAYVSIHFLSFLSYEVNRYITYPGRQKYVWKVVGRRCKKNFFWLF